MDIAVSVTFQPTDSNILLNIPFIGNYEDVDVYGKFNANYAKDSTGPLYYANGSLISVASKDWLSGYNTWDSTNKEINIVINGKTGSSKQIESKSVVCRENKAAWCT